MKAKVYLHKPADFTSAIEVAGCFCEWQGRILLLKRHENSSQGGTWGLPSGKFEKGETPKQAALREVHEETAIQLEPAKLQEIGTLYIKLPHISYSYHMFHCVLSQPPNINLELKEHTAYEWIDPNEAKNFNLIAGGNEVFDYFLKK